MTIDPDFAALSVDPTSLTREGSTNWGEIYLDCGDAAFPARGWTDVVLPVCTAWLGAICALAMGDCFERQVHFMDGPYRCECSVRSAGIVTLRLVEDRVGSQARKELNVDADLLLRDAFSTAGRVLSECRARGWRDDDVISLESVYEYVQGRREILRSGD